jgi:hypothetical protein
LSAAKCWRRACAQLICVLAACLSLTAPTSAQTGPPQAIGAPPALAAKLGRQLAGLHQEFLAHLESRGAGSAPAFRPSDRLLRVENGFVLVDAVAAEDAQALADDVRALGGRHVERHRSLVSALVPIRSLDRLAGLQSLQFARPAMYLLQAGSVTSQGDVAQVSDTARTAFGVDGTGVTVGVISDSYDCDSGADTDVAAGDLPVNVNVLQEACAGIDEGRAMLQIVHDVAPGASLAFQTGAFGRAGFANGIDALVAAGADVIVDDLFYYAEPMFQDGIVAQAVDSAYANGVAYFSAAGNAGTASYESAFRDTGLEGPIGGTLHDFDPGPGVVTAQPITIPVDVEMILVLQWDQPFWSLSPGSGAKTDIAVSLLAADGQTVLTYADDSNINNDPIEGLAFTNDGTLPQGSDTRFYLTIEKWFGPDPGLIKYMYVDNGGGVTVDQFDTQSGTSYGHSVFRKGQRAYPVPHRWLGDRSAGAQATAFRSGARQGQHDIFR